MTKEPLMQHNEKITASIIARWKAKEEAQKKADNTPFRDRKDLQNLWKTLEKACGLNLDWCYNSPEFVPWVKANWDYIQGMENPKEEEL